jgi:DNA-binding LacI/PurR family transcriptional regulator
VTSGLPPVRRPTSADVAKHAGVSRAVVSYVLNGSDHAVSDRARSAVLAAVEALGYAPNGSARTLRAGRSNIVLMPMQNLPFSRAWDELIDSLDRELEARGLCLLLHGDRHASGVEGARVWLEHRPAAVLVYEDRISGQAVEMLERAGTKTLLIGPEPVPYAPTIPLDAASAADVAGRHLIERGHRRLACLVPGGAVSDLANKRLAALEAVASDLGVPVEPVPCNLTPASLTPVVQSWKNRSDRPTGVYAYNDEYALLLVQVLQEAGFAVPADIGIVGSGNIPIGAALRPALTSSYLPMFELGAAAANDIRAMLDGEVLDPERHQAIRPQLVIREST